MIQLTVEEVNSKDYWIGLLDKVVEFGLVKIQMPPIGVNGSKGFSKYHDARYEFEEIGIFGIAGKQVDKDPRMVEVEIRLHGQNI